MCVPSLFSGFCVQTEYICSLLSPVTSKWSPQCSPHYAADIVNGHKDVNTATVCGARPRTIRSHKQWFIQTHLATKRRGRQQVATTLYTHNISPSTTPPQCCGGTRCVPLSALRTSCWQIPPTAALRPLSVKPAGFPLVLLYLSRSLSSLDLVLGIISHKTLTWVNSTW